MEGESWCGEMEYDEGKKKNRSYPLLINFALQGLLQQYYIMEGESWGELEYKSESKHEMNENRE